MLREEDTRSMCTSLLNKLPTSRGLDWTPEVDLTTGLTSTLRSFGAVENTELKQG